ncbi:hypothetical protein O3621_11320, partial [Streptococcus sp. 20925_1_22]
MYQTKQNIIDFVKNYQEKLNTDDDKAKFAAELGERIKQMDFRANNGGAAIIFSGQYGNEEGVQSQIFWTVKNISENSKGSYSLVNDSCEDLLNDSNFYEVLIKKVGEPDANRIMEGGKTASGERNRYIYEGYEALSVKDLVSDNYIRDNARGDVLVLMSTNLPIDSVLAQTELPRLIDSHPDVIAINGIPVEELRQLTQEQRFRKVAEASIRIQENATFYRGEYLGVKNDVEILDLRGKGVAGDIKMAIPEHFRKGETFKIRNILNLYFEGDFSSLNPEHRQALEDFAYKKEAELDGKLSDYTVTLNNKGKIISIETGGFGRIDSGGYIVGLDKLANFSSDVDMKKAYPHFDDLSIKEKFQMKETELVKRHYFEGDFDKLSLEKQQAIKDAVFNRGSRIGGKLEKYQVVLNSHGKITDIHLDGAGRTEKGEIKVSLDQFANFSSDNVMKNRYGGFEELEVEAQILAKKYDSNLREFYHAFNHASPSVKATSLYMKATGKNATELNQVDRFIIQVGERYRDFYSQYPPQIPKSNSNRPNSSANTINGYANRSNMNVNTLSNNKSNTDKANRLSNYDTNFESPNFDLANNLSSMLNSEEVKNSLKNYQKDPNKLKNSASNSVKEYRRNFNKLTNKGLKVIDGIGTGLEVIEGIDTFMNLVNKYNSGKQKEALAEATAISAELVANHFTSQLFTSTLLGLVAIVTGGAAAAPVSFVVLTLGAIYLANYAADFYGQLLHDWIFKGLMGDYEDASKIQYTDPLVLDLAGNGFKPTSLEKGVHFDLDQNGFAERINWIQDDDALLVLDRNGDGAINNGNELFGDYTRMSNGRLARNGFEALGEYDLNQDQIIDEKDEIYNQLRVWQDRNQNGKSEAEELRNLTDAGVAAIQLNYQKNNKRSETEVTFGNTARYIKSSGETAEITEYWVKKRSYDTQMLNLVEVPEDMRKLPDIQGAGLLPSLHQAIARDRSGVLSEKLKQFMTSTDIKERKQLVEEILISISGGNEVDPDSRGNNINAKHLHVIEQILGEKYNGTTGENPHVTAAPRLKAVYNDILDFYYYTLMEQTHLRLVLPFIKINEDKVLDFTILNNVLPMMLKEEKSTEKLESIAGYLKFLESKGISGYSSFKEYFGSRNYSYLKAIMIGAGEVVMGSDKGESLQATEKQAFVMAYGGDDNVQGDKQNNLLDGGS